MLFTQRLMLRPPETQDFEAWADFMADEEQMRLLGGARPRSMTWRALAEMAADGASPASRCSR